MANDATGNRNPNNPQNNENLLSLLAIKKLTIILKHSRKMDMIFSQEVISADCLEPMSAIVAVLTL
jgi:hypothetical protein